MARMGMPAPDFTGEAYVRGEISELSSRQLRGTWVVLVFYPLDFTFIYPAELRAFGQDAEDFRELRAAGIAISVDSVYAYRACCERDLPEMHYPLVSDITKQIARDYRVLDEAKGIALRGTIIVDPEDILQYQVVSADNAGSSPIETLRSLQAQQTGTLCAVNWHPSEKTLRAASISKRCSYGTISMD